MSPFSPPVPFFSPSMHEDGRLTVVHYHHGSDTLTRKTLKSVLEAVGWDLADAKRLGLIS